jgi:hypothetical protein
MSLWFIALVLVFFVVLGMTVRAYIRMQQSYLDGVIQPQRESELALERFVTNPTPQTLGIFFDKMRVLHPIGDEQFSTLVREKILTRLGIELYAHRAGSSAARRIAILNELHQKEYLTDIEYEQHRATILKAV